MAVVRFKDILQLPSLKKMNIVAGGDSLDRIIRWVHVIEIPHAAHWLQGGELLFITGIGIKSDTQALIELVKTVESKKLAGLVINLGPYIEKIPQEVVDLANSLHLPLFELPWEVKLVDVTHEISSLIMREYMEEKSVSHLIEDILFGDPESLETLIRRGVFYGYDLKKAFNVAIIDIDDFAGYLKKKGIIDEGKILELKNYFKQIVLGVLDKLNKRALAISRSDSVILIIPSDALKDKREIKLFADEIRNSLIKQLPSITVSIGIGNPYPDLNDMKKSMKEAELALKVAKTVNDKNVTYSYKDLGIFRLLFKSADAKELESFYQETLGALMEYDNIYKHNFIDTLDVYLSENCNLLKTAETLHLHRNTLKYRIKRIGEITNRDLGNAHERLELQVALLIKKFISLSK